jgi:hypothetical protein
VSCSVSFTLADIIEALDSRRNGLGGEEKHTLQESGIESWLGKATLLTAVPPVQLLLDGI